jgi:hypothetical protein
MADIPLSPAKINHGALLRTWNVVKSGARLTRSDPLNHLHQPYPVRLASQADTCHHCHLPASPDPPADLLCLATCTGSSAHVSLSCGSGVVYCKKSHELSLLNISKQHQQQSRPATAAQGNRQFLRSGRSRASSRPYSRYVCLWARNFRIMLLRAANSARPSCASWRGKLESKGAERAS